MGLSDVSDGLKTLRKGLRTSLLLNDSLEKRAAEVLRNVLDFVRLGTKRAGLDVCQRPKKRCGRALRIRRKRSFHQVMLDAI